MGIRHPLRWTLVALACGLLGIGLCTAVVVVRAESELARHHRIAEGELLALASRSTARSVVLGEAVEGNAWDFYGPALVYLQGALGNSGWEQIRQVEGHPRKTDPPLDSALLAPAFSLIRGAVAPLREGIRRTRVDPSYGVGQTYAAYRQKLQLAAIGLEAFAALILDREHQADDSDRLEMAILALAVSQDFQRSGGREGLRASGWLEQDILGFCRKVFTSWTLSPAEARRFGEGLDRLDQARAPLGDVWVNERLQARSSLLGAETFPDPFSTREISPGWRQLYSTPMMRVQALNLCEDAYRRLIDSAPLPPLDQERLVDEIGNEIPSSSNPVAWRRLAFDRNQSRLDSVPYLLERAHDNRVQRTLMRVAAALACYEAERGKPCHRLEDLIPDYLPRMPVCPLSGQALRFAPGRIWFPGRAERGVSGNTDVGDPDLVWPVSKAPR